MTLTKRKKEKEIEDLEKLPNNYAEGQADPQIPPEIVHADCCVTCFDSNELITMFSTDGKTFCHKFNVKVWLFNKCADFDRRK